MGKLAGFWKKIKSGISKALNVSGNIMQSIANNKIVSTITSLIPEAKLLTNPLNTIVEKVGTTLTKFSDAIDGDISKKELGKYINDEYKYSAFLGPVNAAKTMINEINRAKDNNQNPFTGLVNGAKNVIKDSWDYTKEFL